VHTHVGATGSTCSFLYYCQDSDLYLAGSVNSTSSPVTPFILMGAVMTLFHSR
jgi:hypothetical protein